MILKNSILLTAVISCIISFSYTFSQYEEIYHFEDSSTFNGVDAEEDMNLILIGDYFYGMMPMGGINGLGTIFRVKNDGSDFDKLLDFEYNQYGGLPHGSLYYDGTYLYGTTIVGEPLVPGTIFRILPDGTGYERLMDFEIGTTGEQPEGTLISDGTYLYGCTRYGGDITSGGNIFKIMPDGSNFQVIHSLDINNFTQPVGSLIYDGTYLYGTTYFGGNSNDGTIFKVKTDGTDFTKLFDFDRNNSGMAPTGQLLLKDQFLYGFASLGGDYDAGTLFKIKIDGTGFQKLEDFDNALKGGEPLGSLVIEDSVLYGVCQDGGTEDRGTFFRIDTSGANYQVLDNFSLSKGAHPHGSVLKEGNSFYGITPNAGASGTGTVFQVDMSDTTTTTLHNFDYYLKGKYPTKELVIIDSLVYGTTGGGGKNYNTGTIFRMEKDGSNHQLLHSFEGDSLGSYPLTGLTYDGTFLYGTTQHASQAFSGTVYRIKPDGSQFSVIHEFDTLSEGTRPVGQLELDANYLYGATTAGGNMDKGVLFKVGKNGLGFEKLHDFQGGLDGMTPKEPILINDTLYGVTVGYGSDDHGVIYKSSTDGSFYEIIFDFTMNPNSGVGPYAGLIHHNNSLYGTCRNGGTNGSGTIFSVSKDGSNFTVLHNFTYQYGRLPETRLIEHDNYIYGTTRMGGNEDSGVLFRIRDNGSHFEKLIDFKDQTNGYFPGNLIFDEEHFYSTTSNDQRLVNTGTVFRYKVYDFCASSSVDEIISCDPITWMDGNTYDTTNIEATFILTNSNGCDSTIFLDLTITPVLGISRYPYSLISDAENATYQWVDCDNNYVPISGETNQQFYFTENGNYAVIVTQNGCTDTSECVNISDVSLTEEKQDNISIYPNPTTGKVIITSTELVNFKVLDAMGRVIFNEEAQAKSHVMDLTNHNQGVYLIQLKSNDKVQTFRVILR